MACPDLLYAVGDHASEVAESKTDIDNIMIDILESLGLRRRWELSGKSGDWRKYASIYVTLAFIAYDFIVVINGFYSNCITACCEQYVQGACRRDAVMQWRK